MKDMIFEDMINVIKKLQEKIKLQELEISQLRDAFSKEKIINDNVDSDVGYSTMNLIKYYRNLCKKHYKFSLVITNWLACVATMKKIINIFKKEKLTGEEILKFMDWAILEKTHLGELVPIGYLPYMINKYFHKINTSKNIPDHSWRIG